MSNKRNNSREPKLIVIIKSKIKKGIIIKTPPIVGVSLFLKWLEGPSALIFWSKFNFLIIFRPFFVVNKEITKFFSEKYQVKNLIIKLIDSEFIQHKLSHINIRSRFWLTENKINVDEGIYVSSFKEYPMSQLMHKFIEKYTNELSIY